MPPKKRNTGGTVTSTPTSHGGPPNRIQEFVDKCNSWPPETLKQRATASLNSRDTTREILRLSPNDQAKFVDTIDKVFPTLETPRDVKNIAALGEMCSRIKQLPTSAVLSRGLKKSGDSAVISGGFAPIWRGELGGAGVAIKAFRLSPKNLKNAQEVLWKRVPTWRRLSHTNVLPFLGVDMTVFRLAFVYDWMQDGNIIQYIKSHPDAPRPPLVFDVAKGLEYLHNLGIPHGGLKRENVVIDRSGLARLMDYGLAAFYSSANFESVEPVFRWSAPEITDPIIKNSMPVLESKPADIFAFGMLAAEVFSGESPFKEKNETVVLRISRGDRPEKPGNAEAVGLTAQMWGVLESCWQRYPQERPTAQQIVGSWGKFVGGGELDASPVASQPVVGSGRGAGLPWAKTGTPPRTVTDPAHPQPSYSPPPLQTDGPPPSQPAHPPPPRQTPSRPHRTKADPPPPPQTKVDDLPPPKKAEIIPFQAEIEAVPTRTEVNEPPPPTKPEAVPQPQGEIGAPPTNTDAPQPPQRKSDVPLLRVKPGAPPTDIGVSPSEGEARTAQPQSKPDAARSRIETVPSLPQTKLVILPPETRSGTSLPQTNPVTPPPETGSIIILPQTNYITSQPQMSADPPPSKTPSSGVTQEQKIPAASQDSGTKTTKSTQEEKPAGTQENLGSKAAESKPQEQKECRCCAIM